MEAIFTFFKSTTYFKLFLRFAVVAFIFLGIAAWEVQTELKKYHPRTPQEDSECQQITNQCSESYMNETPQEDHFDQCVESKVSQLTFRCQNAPEWKQLFYKSNQINSLLVLVAVFFMACLAKWTTAIKHAGHRRVFIFTGILNSLLFLVILQMFFEWGAYWKVWCLLSFTHYFVLMFVYNTFKWIGSGYMER